MENLEQQLIKARELVGKFDQFQITINCLSLHDLGGGPLGGYVATFDFEETLQSESDYEYWFEHAEDFPRTARAETAAEAISKAVEKCEAELSEYVRKNFRYSPEIQKEFCKL